MKSIINYSVTTLLLFLLLIVTDALAWGGDPYPNPKTIDQLRQHMNWKIKNAYANGNVYYVNNPSDGNPILLVSSKVSTAIKQTYLTMVNPGDDREVCIGTHTYTKRDKIWFTTITRCSNLNPDESTQNSVIETIQTIVNQASQGNINIIRVDFSAIPTRNPFRDRIDDLATHKLDFMKRYAVTPFDGLISAPMDGKSQYIDLLSILDVEEENRIIKATLRDFTRPDKKEAKELVQGGAKRIYFLPWFSNYIIRMQLGGERDIFFTAALSGCSVFVTGAPNSPTVYHAGVNGPLQYGGEEAALLKAKNAGDAPLFWRTLLGLKDPDTRRDRRFAEINKLDYTAPGGQSTPRSQEYVRQLKQLHRFDGIDIAMDIPWGTVFGFRTGSNWAFYLQENATIGYKLNGSSQVTYISMPIAIRQFYPNTVDHTANLLGPYQRLRIEW